MTESKSAPAIDLPRKRTWLRRIGRSVVRLLLLGVILWFGWRTWFDYSGRRELDAFIDELDAADPQWRLEDIESAREVVPEEKNSARVVIAANDKLPKDWLRVWDGPVPGQKGLHERLLAIPPPVLLDDGLTRYLRTELGKLGPTLDKARPLAELPRGRFEIHYADDFLSTILHDQQKCRQIANLLRIDAILLAQEGEIDSALASCRGAANAGRAIGDEPMLISLLLRIACVNLAQGTMERVLAQGEASDEALRRVQELLADEEKQSLLRPAMRGERAGLSRLMTALEQGKIDLETLAGGSRKSWLTGEDVTLFLLGPGFYKRNHYWSLKLMTEGVEAAGLPEADRAARLAAWEARLKQLKTEQIPGGSRIDAIVPLLMMPAMKKIADAFQRHQATLRCSICLLAAERYRLRHKRWPASLDELVKDKLLEKIPLDPFDGKPIRFRRTGDGLLVYTTGPDLIDNGGLIDREKVIEPGTDIGLQLWDVAKRRSKPRQR